MDVFWIIKRKYETHFQEDVHAVGEEHVTLQLDDRDGCRFSL